MKFAKFLFVFALAAIAQAAEEAAPALREALIRQYGSLEQSPVASGLLHDLVLPLSGLSELDGAVAAPAVTSARWRQAASELRRASLVPSALPEDVEFRAAARQAAHDRVYPILLLDYRYHRSRPGAIPDALLRPDASGAPTLDAESVIEARAFAAGTLHDHTYRGREVRFSFDPAQYYTNNTRPARLEIDFDDGRGFRPLRAGEQVVRYESVGIKQVQVRAEGSGFSLFGRFRFHVRTLDTPVPDQIWQVQAAIPYNGEYATGEAYVLFAPGHAQLTRPVVLSEGLDLNNTMNWDELYTLMNQENLLETLRDMGYDAVVLNYTNSTTHVQANGLLVAELISQVQQAVVDTTTLAVVGASMGGLTTRYALAYMETHGLQHRVRTWISFDSPQNGANIPLGLQYWVDFFASESVDAAAMRDALNTPSPRQMLLVHFTSPPSAVPAPDPLRAGLLSDFAALGDYPAQPRRVAVANGSRTGAGQGFNAGDQLVSYEYYSWLVDIIGNVWALPNAASQTVFRGVIDQIWPFPDRSRTVTVQPAWPWDNAPGGFTATMAEMDSIAVPYGDLIALHPAHCFIPTISALGLNVSDPFYDIAGDPDLYSHTAFDSLYAPAVNQDHVQVTPESFWWFINEVCLPLPPPVVVIEGAETQTRLSWAPVPGAQSYRVYTSSDLNQWPTEYVTAPDTLWVDPAPSAMLKYYRVVASAAPLAP